METRTVEQIEDWDARPFSGGYAGLHELADAQFSGAVSAGRAWLFMLNGRVVGVFEGTIEDFEGRDGTLYRAPDPSLPLLFSMLELGGETQANYYTNDTPLSEANGTLADAGFTGYIELSENVLSGDYYTVYYGGRSMSAAFVGASERLLTGDEAFDRADDEVGIYEVVDVDLELIDVPEVEEPEPDPEPTAAVVDEPDEPEEAESSESGESVPPTEPTPDPEPVSGDPETGDAGVTPDPLDSSTPEPGETGEPTEPEPAPTGADRAEAGAAESAPAEPRTRPEESAGRPAEAEPERRPPSAGTPEPDPETREANRPEAGERNAGRPDERGGATPQTPSGAPRSDDDVFSEEEQWRETKSIPSLDPERSEAGESAGAGAGGRTAKAGPARSRNESAGRGRGQRAAQEQRRQREKPTPQQSPRGRAEATAGRSDRAEELEASLRKHKQEIERLRSEVSDLQSERERFEEERAEFEEERSELEGEIRRLKGELEEARAEAAASAGAAGGVAGGQQLTPEEALEGTNLFVRYGSKGKPTLETAHSGRADKDEVNDNLKLEHHTQFDADDVTVDGRPFDEFLRTTIEYNFVRWAVCELLYEIRDTGHKGGMREVYDALPRVDRAELGGTVSATTMADGEEQERIEEFDVILRDRMGNPLLVANLNDSRDPATGDVMSSLIDSASAVCESHEELGGAFYVTASFFEPAALETASEATSGGLLSREKRDSYVKFARKRGYHLCLVETRAGEFHVNVPEL